MSIPLKRATLQEVAVRAGVSKMTASNALRGREGQSSAETRERVLQAARELGYIPVRPTLQNRRSATRTLGFVSDRHEWLSPLEVGTYVGARNGCLHASYDLLTLLRSESDWVLGSDEMGLLDQRCDGLLFMAENLSAWHDSLGQLVAHGTPVVACYSRDVPDGVGWVDPDNAQAMRNAVEHLLALGHVNIGFWSRYDEQYDVAARRQEFERVMHERGLAPFCTLQFHEEADNAPQLLRAWHDGATAFVCVNDVTALGVWRTAKACDLNVPRDLSLVGVDNYPRDSNYPLTTSGFHYAEVGRAAVKAVLALLTHSPLEAARQTVPVTFIERSSTATPTPRALKVRAAVQPARDVPRTPSLNLLDSLSTESKTS